MQLTPPGPGPLEHFRHLLIALDEADSLLERVAMTELNHAGFRVEVRPDRRRVGFAEGADPVDLRRQKDEPGRSGIRPGSKSPFA